MTTAKPLGAVNGLEQVEKPGQITVWRDLELIGYTFPAKVSESYGLWYAKLRGQHAVKVASREAGLRYLVGPRRVKVIGDLYHGRTPDGAIYVGRAAPGLKASPYANPHKVGGLCRLCYLEHDRQSAVDAYDQDFIDHPELLAAARRDLAGRDLACWCRLDGLPCHADRLLLAVNTYAINELTKEIR